MQFGMLLKEYIKKQGLTIYQLAKETGIDRSFLQGVLNGKRKLPKKRFSDIVNSNYFTESQIHALCQEYFLERFGKEKVERFEYLEKGITGKIKEELSTEYPAEFIDIKKETSFFSGKKEVLNLIYTILNHDEIHSFISNFDFSNMEINRIVYHSCKQGKIKDFFHFVDMDEFSGIRNIRTVFNALHYAEIGYLTHSYQKYSANSLMPYFIIADNYFLSFDETAENAVLLDTDLMSLFLKRKISDIKKECRPHIIITDNALEYMKTVSTITVTSLSSIMAGFDNQICPTFITPEIIERIATPEVKNIPSIIQQLTSHYSLIIGNNGQQSLLNFLVVTYDAIKDFVENGYIGGFPRTLANPVPKELRSFFLKALIDKNNLGKLVLTNPNMFKSSYDVNYQINNNYLVIASSQGLKDPDDYNGRITYYTDREIIANDFKDYLDYLAMSEKTYSQEISKSIIEAFIQQLDAE